MLISWNWKGISGFTQNGCPHRLKVDNVNYCIIYALSRRFEKEGKKKPTMACHLVEKEYINDSFNE